MDEIDQADSLTNPCPTVISQDPLVWDGNFRKRETNMQKASSRLKLKKGKKLWRIQGTQLLHLSLRIPDMTCVSEWWLCSAFTAFSQCTRNYTQYLPLAGPPTVSSSNASYPAAYVTTPSAAGKMFKDHSNANDTAPNERDWARDAPGNMLDH